MTMNLTLNDAQRLVVIDNWSADEWAANTVLIPDDYTIQFQPTISTDDLNSIAKGRELFYAPVEIFTNRPFGTGYITEATTVYVQQLLPVVVTAT